MASSAAPASDSAATPAASRTFVWGRRLAAVALVALTFYSGGRRLDAPWIQGDEHMFIVHNPDVTGEGRAEPFWQRCLGIFTHVHHDLYQPIPVLTYALEWRVWGADAVGAVRRIDLLIHALNALLIWRLFVRLLRRRDGPDSPGLDALAWSLALLWALHPVLVATYAADMGRTHLLSCLFSLLALHTHVCAIDSRKWRWTLPTLLCLAAAMLCKPVVGWFVVALVLHWLRRDLRSAVMSPANYAYLAVCAAFAWLTLSTSRDAGMIDDVGLAIAGDPITRSLLAATLYLTHIVLPFDLATWYPPLLGTGWTHPDVWIGAVIVAASMAAIVLAGRSARFRGVAVGLLWYWALLTPMLGLVGARVAAAQDRYLYQPLIGFVFAIAALAAAMTRQASSRVAARGVWVVAAAFALVAFVLIPIDREYAFDVRGTVRRAERVGEIFPNDPRCQSMLARAYMFAADHLPDAPTTLPDDHGSAHEALLRAGQLADEHSEYFADSAHRAWFYRDISLRLQSIDDVDGALRFAIRAAEFERDSVETLTRVAHAQRAAERWDDALLTYLELEARLPDDPEIRAKRLTELGDLCIVYNSPAEALPRYRAAVETGYPLREAALGLARSELLAGDLERGFAQIDRLLTQNADDRDAQLLLAIYFGIRQQFAEADAIYRKLLALDPTNYEALRGFHETCAQFGRWREAAYAWQTASERAPTNQAFRDYLIWAAACAGEESAAVWAERQLERVPNDPFPCFARMLFALRAHDLAAALDWLRRGLRGEGRSGAKEPVRAERTLELMLRRDEIPRIALVAQAAFLLDRGDAEQARERLSAFLTGGPADADRAIAEALLK